MSEPSPVSPDVLRRMREVISTAIATRSMTVLEAAAEARGLGRGLQPALPAEAFARAVTDLLRELGCYQAPQVVEDAAGAALSPADPAEVADSLAYAMRFDERGKARRTGVEYASQLAAAQLVRQLTASGYVVMRRRPPPALR
ncbi:hypothetical protein ACFQS7_29190 [Dankookia sp. GCM10030260]|uniref:hypothetical protein n=1 Tax=Dankookia sp. GCM10030260 TaxID=3273390 RepID=UPI00360DE20D